MQISDSVGTHWAHTANQKPISAMSFVFSSLQWIHTAHTTDTAIHLYIHTNHESLFAYIFSQLIILVSTDSMPSVPKEDLHHRQQFNLLLHCRALVRL